MNNGFNPSHGAYEGLEILNVGGNRILFMIYWLNTQAAEMIFIA